MRDRNLKGKKILFVAYNYFNYNIEIKNKLENLGAEVDMFEQVKYSLFYTILLRMRLGEKYMGYLANRIINIAKQKKYNYVFVLEIKQQESFYQKLRELQPTAKFILYYWDSVKFYDYRPFLKFFHKTYSFDLKDANTNENIEYLPLFFIDAYAKIRKESVTKYKYDLLQVASFGEERYNKMKKFISSSGIDTSKIYICYVTTFANYFALMLKGYDMSWISWKNRSQKEITDLYKQSKCILDFDKKQQSGLSMRTIESMGAGKKIVTANKNLKIEPIYTPDNIFILGDDKIEELKIFLDKKFNYLEKIEDYSLQNWCLKLFDIN